MDDQNSTSNHLSISMPQNIDEFEYAMCSCGYKIEHCGDGHDEDCHFKKWTADGRPFSREQEFPESFE